MLRHLASKTIVFSEQRLQVHRLPHGTRLNVFSRECTTQVFATSTAFRGIDQNACKPSRAATERRFGHEFQSRNAGKSALISGTVFPTRLDPFLQMTELAASDGGKDVAHPVVEAQFGVLVVRRWIAGLGSEKTGFFNEHGLGRNQHASARRRDDFVAVEGKHSEASTS